MGCVPACWLRPWTAVDLLEGLIALAIDEVKAKKGQRHLTVVSDPFSGRVVWVIEGRSKATVTAFFDALGSERAAQLEIVTTDGASWIRSVVARTSPQRRDLLGHLPCHLVGDQSAG